MLRRLTEGENNSLVWARAAIPGGYPFNEEVDEWEDDCAERTEMMTIEEKVNCHTIK